MPVSPEQAKTRAETIGRIYEAAERAILATIAGKLAKGLTAPDWLGEKHAAVGPILTAVRRILTGARQQAQPEIHQAVRDAAGLGRHEAVAEVAEATGHTVGDLSGDVNRAALDEIAAAAIDDGIVPPVHSVLRGVRDAYQQVVTESAAAAITGAETRRQAEQRALWHLADDGVTGFTDQAGRSWNLASYVEMATRTATTRALLNAHTRSLLDMGERWVWVSDSPRECALCRPWEGRVLALTSDADTGTVTTQSEIGGQVSFTVASTLADARLAGLFHPNCTHRVALYLPGVTSMPTDTADPEGDEARQRLRALERQVRHWKRREAAAITPDARSKARGKVRAYQAAIRDHVDSTTVKRRSDREQIGMGKRPAEAPEAMRTPWPEPEPAAPVNLADLSDDDLATRMADPDITDTELDTLVEEMDRRQRYAEDPDAAKWDAGDRLVEQEGMGYDQAYAEVFNVDPEKLAREAAIANLRAEGFQGRGFDELAREAYRVEVARQIHQAEDATRGYLTSRQGQARGMDPRELWRQNEAFARKWASDELKEWWDAHGRLTFADFKDRLLSGGAGSRERTGAEDFLR